MGDVGIVGEDGEGPVRGEKADQSTVLPVRYRSFRSQHRKDDKGPGGGPGSFDMVEGLPVSLKWQLPKAGWMSRSPKAASYSTLSAYWAK